MQRITVGVREAKANLSRLLAYVESGAEVTITERRRPVARIVRVPASDLPLKDRIAELEKRGWIDAARKPGGVALPAPLPLPDGLARRFLQEDREG
jgi:prevent-host-death family protein